MYIYIYKISIPVQKHFLIIHNKVLDLVLLKDLQIQYSNVSVFSIKYFH